MAQHGDRERKRSYRPPHYSSSVCAIALFNPSSSYPDFCSIILLLEGIAAARQYAGRIARSDQRYADLETKLR
jgi:hypothetical protein